MPHLLHVLLIARLRVPADFDYFVDANKMVQT
jgi:hypothetical protein